jgi:hypothetical protein
VSDEIASAIAPLAGRTLSGAVRAANVLRLDFNGGALLLDVFCAWRLTDGGRIAVASGDLFTPSDPDADLETFDWEPEGAAWWDVRLRELLASRAAPPVVERVAADAFGGVRLELTGGLALEVFANSSPAEHVATEFWRLVPRDAAEPVLVVSTLGVERQPQQ